MSAWGGMWPAATKRTSLLALMRPQPVIWSHPAVVTKRWEAGSVVAKLLGGPHCGGAGAQRGVEKSMSSAASRKSCLASSAARGRPDGLALITPLCTALRAAEYRSPAMPDDCPVASEEHDDDSTETHE